MGKAVRASVLVLIFACSAQAGWIQNDVTGTQPSGTVQAEPAANGWIHNGEPESLTETVLSVLESMLSLL